MRPMAVVVINQDTKHLLEMLDVQDQEPIQTFRPNRPHEPLRAAAPSDTAPVVLADAGVENVAFRPRPPRVRASGGEAGRTGDRTSHQ